MILNLTCYCTSGKYLLSSRSDVNLQVNLVWNYNLNIYMVSLACSYWNCGILSITVTKLLPNEKS